MKVKENRTVLLLSLFIVTALVILTIMGSYAFYQSTLTTKGTATGPSVKAGNLQLDFADGTSNVNLTNMIPGDSYSKKFTIKNSGTESVKFKIIIKDVTNTFTNKKDVTITVKQGTTAIKSNVQFPTAKAAITDTITLAPSATATSYEVIITYNSTTADQTGDMEKKLVGTIFIEGAA